MAEERVIPPAIFILADDDGEAMRRICYSLTSEWYFVPVWQPERVVRFAKRFSARAVFIADRVEYPRGGAARLLARVVDEVGTPVVILAELWEPKVRAKWKRMGAADCIPHPTRTRERMELLRAKMQEFALHGVSRDDPGSG